MSKNLEERGSNVALFRETILLISSRSVIRFNKLSIRLKYLGIKILYSTICFDFII